jgi:hypothetical protein
MAGKQVFELGEQPEWAGTEPAVYVPDLISTLLDEGTSTSLQKRGYGLVRLEKGTRDAYDSFFSSFEEFCDGSMEEKAAYALHQFDADEHSPNQYHGFSVVSGLKEQFMFRVGNGASELLVPQAMGEKSTILYEKLDQICRKEAIDAISNLSSSPCSPLEATQMVEQILDPVQDLGSKCLFAEEDNKGKEDEKAKRRVGSGFVTTKYVPNGYVSSSILDCFHYQREFDKEGNKEEKTEEPKYEETERFQNNHGSHTDSGFLTLVVTTDFPGLEIFDPVVGEWIAPEAQLHEYLKKKGEKGPLPHRNYAFLFWSESVCYLNKNKNVAPFKACVHRVGRCKEKRSSVVFKQRTAPLYTACRYQEDYPLAKVQMDALVACGMAPGEENLDLFSALVGVCAVASVLYMS